MRELVINFSTEGDAFSGLDENKSYYFTEAEEAIAKVRHQLKVSGREVFVQPKRFGLYINGKFLLDSTIRFEDTKSIEQQIKDTFTRADAWSEEVKAKNLNILKELIEAEKAAFLNREFKGFAVTMRDKFERSSDFLFSLKQLQRLFESVYSKVSNGFYSYLEAIVISIYDSYIMLMKDQELLIGKHEEISVKKEEWFNNESNLKKFCMFITASYFSIKTNRLPSIMITHPLYQNFQDYLFEFKETKFPEDKQIELSVNERIYKRFTEVLMGGTTLTRDEEIKNLVITKVINEFFSDELKKTDLTEDELRFCEKASGMETRF